MRTGAAGVGGRAALVLLLPMEADVPIPLPADLVMFTVVAAGVSGLNGRRALPALILGSSVFLQLHLVLGLLLGPLADRAFDQAKGPAVAAVAVLAAGALVFWRVRRRNLAPAAWTEGTCPACLGVRALAERVPALTGLVPGLAEAAAAEPAGSGPDDQPNPLAT
jgi:MYXO-CTERM domain-containing protein